MDYGEVFPTKFLKASDLNGEVKRATVAGLSMEPVGDDGTIKPVLRFSGAQRGLVLNRVNGEVLRKARGDETDNWSGVEVELFSMPVQFQGRVVDGLRLRIPAPPSAAADDGPDDVPW